MARTLSGPAVKLNTVTVQPAPPRGRMRIDHHEAAVRIVR